MDFDDTPEEAKFRQDVRNWIDANAPHHLDEQLAEGSLDRDRVVEDGRAWMMKKAEAGWACMHWPTEYGGMDATPIQRVIWNQEEGIYSALNAPFGIGQGMCGPTVMDWAQEQHKRDRLPKLASGEEIWCQLFSEPAGGSDLAGLRTSAKPADDGSGDWIINGQKIWTSGAHYSDWGLLITRTDPNVQKHKGLTMFILRMDLPGVDIRPIKQINGGANFNEVFFTDVRVPDHQRLGDVGQGWQVSLTTLMNERFSIGARLQTGFPEFFDYCMQAEIDGQPAIDDPSLRSKLASLAVRNSGLKYTAMRSISAVSKGQTPGPENSIGKLVAAPMLQEIGMLAMDLQAEAGALLDHDADADGKFQGMMMWAPGLRIAGGTDEVMRNIIGERVLGLPGDIRVDKSVAFNEIPTSGSRK
ncbi:MAG: acyl-CoA dehydrogenase family protein [Minwuia sp.]|uniref:acyl-CoA dehydrogenase family protein n=1 Tax=Minwuia sp. TaxID=2493630 RepID=UPI003A84FF72